MEDNQNLKQKISNFETGDKVKFITQDSSDKLNQSISRFVTSTEERAIFKTGEEGTGDILI
jgi:hypothetical protein